MRSIDQWLTAYGVSHQNKTNKAIHWICVPAIMFSIFGLLMSIPVPFIERTMTINWAALALLLSLAFYIRLSLSMFFGFVLIGFLMLWGNWVLLQADFAPLWLISLIIFVVAWIGQFIGHKIEGAKPSFFEDLQFLLIGPAWLMHFIFKKIGINY